MAPMTTRQWCSRVTALSLGVVGSWVLLSASATGAQAPATRAGTNHVVYISLDGFMSSSLDDPFLPVPTLRRLATNGATAKAMRPVNPTVTWANHTSMVTGVTPARHHVIFNGLLVRQPGVPPVVEPWRDKSEMVRAPTLYDVAHAAGLTTAQVDWVAIWNAPTITWEFRERPEVSQPIPQEMIKAGLVSEADIASFGTRNIVWRDEIWTTAAVHIIRQHRPNVMLFHLLNLDSTQHRYGPRTPAAMTTMAHLDAQVARVVDAVDQAGLTNRTTFLIVSDHGFKTVRRHIRPNAAFAASGLLQVTGGKVASAQAYSVPEGGTALVYLTTPDPSGAILQRVKASLAGLEGIERVVEPAEFGDYGLPRPEESNQMGTLFLVGREGYAFSADAAGPAVVDVPPASLGSHGYVATDPELSALFIASGRGIRKGVTLESVNTIDLAPTAARLLGVSLGDVQGRVLQEILE
jgi:predicted AlkP superfamily pyrophosphatase or phosphodiesterase